MKIKQIGRKIAPYTVAGLMSLPCYARANDSLPVYQETRQEVAEYVKSGNFELNEKDSISNFCVTGKGLEQKTQQNEKNENTHKSHGVWQGVMIFSGGWNTGFLLAKLIYDRNRGKSYY